MPPPIKIAVINSLSFTGTTWLNLVLGSHPRAFALGPPDRIINLDRGRPDDACRVHAGACPFWPPFLAGLDPDENFFVQLADHAKRDVILTNNPLPDGAARQLDHPRIELKRVHLVRDGRAIAASYHRKYPDTPFLDAVRDWLFPSFSTFAFDPADPDRLCLRYEDVLADQRDALDRFGAFLGLEYDDSALAYWTHEHHITAGNAGSIMMIKLEQGVAVPDNANRVFYAEQLDTLRADPTRTFADARWRDELSRRDLFVFDHFCGAVNERFGYERDAFTVDELRTFGRELEIAIGASSALETNDTAAVAAAPTPDASPSPSALSVPPPPLITPLIPAPPGAETATRGTRSQLTPSSLRRHGLHLSPRQSMRLARFAAVAIVVLVAAAITVTAIAMR